MKATIGKILILCLMFAGCRFSSQESKEPIGSSLGLHLDGKKVFGSFPIVDESMNQTFFGTSPGTFQEKEQASYTERLSAISCHKKEDLVSCFVGKQSSDLIKEPKQIKKDQLPSELAVSVWDIFQRLRPDLEKEPKAIASLLCRSYKEDLPPYKKGLGICFIYDPAKPKEAYLAEANSYSIASSLKGNHPFQSPSDQVTGSAICQWKSSGYHECTLDGPMDMSASTYLKLDKKIAAECYQKVKEVYITLEPSLLQKPVVHLPPEQMFHVFCQISSVKDEKPTAACRIALP